LKVYWDGNKILVQHTGQTAFIFLHQSAAYIKPINFEGLLMLIKVCEVGNSFRCSYTGVQNGSTSGNSSYMIAYKVQPSDQMSVLSSMSAWLGQSHNSGALKGAEQCSEAHSYMKNIQRSIMRRTCNCNASERDRICFLAGRALPKSINIVKGPDILQPKVGLKIPNHFIALPFNFYNKNEDPPTPQNYSLSSKQVIIFPSNQQLPKPPQKNSGSDDENDNITGDVSRVLDFGGDAIGRVRRVGEKLFHQVDVGESALAELPHDPETVLVDPDVSGAINGVV
ncbi:exocyst subunit exo70 family protein A1, partial [Striga asiatica]